MPISKKLNPHLKSRRWWLSSKAPGWGPATAFDNGDIWYALEGFDPIQIDVVQIPGTRELMFWKISASAGDGAYYESAGTYSTTKQAKAAAEKLLVEILSLLCSRIGGGKVKCR
jgi:hypothetical protein